MSGRLLFVNRRWWVGSCVAVVLCGAEASAQTAENFTATRRELLQQAQQARESGDHLHALERAQRAGEIEMSPSLRVFIAEEQLTLRLYAPALNTAMQCVREVDLAPNINNAAAIRTRCVQLQEEVQQHLARVTVRVPEGAPNDLRVRVADEELPRALWGVPHIVSAGRVRIEVRQQGHPMRELSVVATAGSTHEVQIPLRDEALRDVSPGDSQPSWWLRAGPGPYLVAGVGVASLLSALPLFLARDAAAAELFQGSSDQCFRQGDSWICRSSAEANYRSAETLQTVGVVAMVAGGALLTGGVIWLVAAPRRAQRAEEETLTLRVGPGFVGANLRF